MWLRQAKAGSTDSGAGTRRPGPTLPAPNATHSKIQFCYQNLRKYSILLSSLC